MRGSLSAKYIYSSTYARFR
ncbi:hypothetical protein [Escherichia coli]